MSPISLLKAKHIDTEIKIYYYYYHQSLFLRIPSPPPMGDTFLVNLVSLMYPLASLGGCKTVLLVTSILDSDLQTIWLGSQKATSTPKCQTGEPGEKPSKHGRDKVHNLLSTTHIKFDNQHQAIPRWSPIPL